MEEIRGKFQQEAMEQIRGAEKSIQSYADNPSEPKNLTEANRRLHALKGSAPLVGARPVSDVARTIEACLNHVLANPSLFTPALHATLRFALTLLERQIGDFVAGQPIREGQEVIRTVRSYMPVAQSVEELLRNIELISQELRNSVGETLQSILGRELDEGRRLFVLHIAPHHEMATELPKIRGSLKGFGSILSVAGREEGSLHLLVSSTHPGDILEKELKTFQGILTELVATDLLVQETKSTEKAALAAPSSGGEGKIRILFSDDSRITRDIYRMLLEKNGYEVIVAEDGEQAMKNLNESQFDAVITDDEMPGMDGIDILRESRKRESLRHIPFIMISGHASEEARTRALESGATDYLVKGDFEKEQLLVILREVILRKGGQK